MMATYRGARTLGVLENKLLAATAMRKVGSFRVFPVAMQRHRQILASSAAG